MAGLVIEAEKRTEFGKNANRRLRAAGKLPGVVYGPKIETSSIVVDPADLTSILQSESGHNTIFTLKVNGEPLDVMIREYALDPLKGTLVHADFLRIVMDQIMQFAVPVEVDGTSAGVKEGGMLDLVLREIDVECLPAEVPDNIRVDVTELEIGDAIRVGDIPFDNENVKILSDAEFVVATVIPPRVEEEEEVEIVEEEEEGAEPEVIGKGKAEDGEPPASAPEEPAGE
jgi:large subunit ribosomal protein L25